METDLVLGLFFLVVGLAGTVFAFRYSRFIERLDAVGGSTPSEEVEPPRWKVRFNRLVFAGLAVVGAVLVLRGLSVIG